MSINLGHYSGGGTPVPISNTAVKSSSAYGTSGLPWWESRSWPSLMYNLSYNLYFDVVICDTLKYFLKDIPFMISIKKIVLFLTILVMKSICFGFSNHHLLIGYAHPLSANQSFLRDVTSTSTGDLSGGLNFHYDFNVSNMPFNFVVKHSTSELNVRNDGQSVHFVKTTDHTLSIGGLMYFTWDEFKKLPFIAKNIRFFIGAGISMGSYEFSNTLTGTTDLKNKTYPYINLGINRYFSDRLEWLLNTNFRIPLETSVEFSEIGQTREFTYGPTLSFNIGRRF